MARESRFASWLPNSSQLHPFFEGVRQFVAAHLVLPEGTDAERIGPKLVVDPLLGYIHLHPWEAALLDTSLFQRLRRIKQLGLAYLVFPTLNYSRFEHTLGVLGRLDQVLVKLQENEKRLWRGHHLVDLVARYETAVRLAALFHDCGHCIFSHVTERVIHGLSGNGAYPSAEAIRRAFSEHFATPRPIPMAEVFSVSCLGMPEVVAFLEPLEIPGKRNRIAEHLEHAARFVLGLPILNDPESCFVAQVMSSGLDVDKLDYMPREAYFSGIALEIDLARILDKLRVFQLASSQVPDGLMHYKRMLPSEARAGYHILGLARGGQFAYEEFCVARVALYEKIYLHQKVRAAEAQLASKLARLPYLANEFTEVHRWLWLKESYQEHEGSQLPTLEAPSLFSQKLPTFAAIGLRTLEQRSLLNRAFAFGPANCLTDPLETSISLASTDQRPMTSHRLMQLVGRDVEGLAKQIKANAVWIAREIGGEDQMPSGSDESITIDLPRYSPVQQGHDTLHFERPARLPIKWAMPIDRIVDYYQRNRALGYVFAPRRLCSIVSVAAERAIWDMSGAVFEQDSVVSSSVVTGADEIRKTLAEKGFYTDARALQPMSTYLQTLEAHEDIQRIVYNLRSFESFRHERVTVSTVETFVSQFPSELQEVCVKWLLLLEVVGEDVLVQTVGDALHQVNGELATKVAVVPLGGLSDSATRMAYALRGQKAGDDLTIPETLSLSDQLIMQSDGLVFYDDNVNTGRQALNIVAQWVGASLPSDVVLAETHVQRLADPAVARLRELRIAFAFSVGVEGCDHKLVELLEKHCGLRRDNVLLCVGRPLLKRERPFSGGSKWQHGRSSQLGDFLLRCGRDLLKAEGSSPEKATASALGYGGAEAMIAFPYNVPTMTIVALWCRGKIGSQEWMPLVERRRRHTVTGALQSDEKA